MFQFPDFSSDCPICGATDCAVFLCFYSRQAVDCNGTYFKELLIARFKCRKKGKRKIKHSTFSLLPNELIPYSKYSLPFIFKALNLKYINNFTNDKILDFFTVLDEEENLSLSPNIFSLFTKLACSAIMKLLTSSIYSIDLKSNFTSIDIKQRIKIFIEFAENFDCTKSDKPIRGSCALGYDFYLTHGSYYDNAQFLFGTPSQFRN